nr:MAG TPA: DNA relaxase TraI 2B/2B-like domain [Caudoviricetes sp.]
MFQTSLFFIKWLPTGFTKNYKPTMVIQFEKNVK